MKDDLISRKALIENLNRFAPEHYTSLVNDLIMKQPTAFNKEKVIAKLKDQYNYSRKVRNENGNKYFEYWDGRTDSYKDAIEIVEKGGVR